jgi:hypothetical protein
MKFTHKVMRERMESLDLALHGYLEHDHAEPVLNEWARFMVVLANEMHRTAGTDFERGQWSEIRESAKEWLDWRPPKVTVVPTGPPPTAVSHGGTT